MDLKYQAHCYSFKAKGYDEKVEIIRNVYKELGFPGIDEFAELTGKDREKLVRYAVLDRFREDRNRGRRQRKPKKRVTAGDMIQPEIEKQLLHWK